MKRKQLLLLLALLMTAATGAWAQESETYAVKMKAGTEDAKNWTITSGQKSATGDNADGLTGLSEKDAVTLNYGGRLKVKSVTAVQVPDATDLSMLDCAGAPRTDGRWTANCYMVHTAGNYKLPLVYGNAIKAGQANTAAYTGVESNFTTVTFPNHAGEAIDAPWITKKTTGTGVDKGMGIAVTQAELLWQDAEGLVTAVDIDGDYLTLTVGKDATTKEGNAVVAAKDADGNIVWSWHIWVTKQTFADADLTTITTTNDTQTGTQGVNWQIYKVTPVNLGWVGDNVSTGTNTFYQWGRKDPFIGTGDVEFVESTTATIADHIMNPTKFYTIKEVTNNKTYYYPCIERYYNLWDAMQTKPDVGKWDIKNATVKTVYDPCPAGFCVPTSNLYEYFHNYIGDYNTPDWDDTYNGFIVNIGTPSLFFPATGQRYCTNNGKFGDSVGIDGRSWSANAYGTSTTDCGIALYFYYVSANDKFWYTGNKDRAYGYPVRAVAEAPEATSDAPAATVVDLSTVSGDTYTVTGDVILTGTPTESLFYIMYGDGDYEVTLDNVNSAGSKQVLVDGVRHNINIKLKGTSRLKEIYTGDMNNKTVTIGEAAAGGTLILTGSTAPIRAKSLTINGGTVKSQATGDNWAVYLNNLGGVLTIYGGALYLAAGDDETQAVKGTVSGTVTLYGWNGSAWETYSDHRYLSTDNSKAPSQWTW